MVFEHGRDWTAWNSQSCNPESLCSPVRCDQEGSLRDQRGSNGTGMSLPKNGRNPVLRGQPFITAGMDQDGFRYKLKKINYIKLNDHWPSSPECKQNLEVLKFFFSGNRKSHCAGYLSLVPDGLKCDCLLVIRWKNLWALQDFFTFWTRVNGHVVWYNLSSLTYPWSHHDPSLL